jgi:SAM-dependent methyltransferase
MNYKYKILFQNLLSKTPGGNYLNYLLQKHVTKSLPASDDKFLKKVNEAFLHYKNFTEFNTLTSNDNNYYEFGAGQDFIIPLTISLLGFKCTCIDLNAIAIKELLVDSMKRFEKLEDQLPFKIDKQNIPVVERRNIFRVLEENYSLRYVAPKDARKTGFWDNSFDFMSSTAVFEHVPKGDILLILQESERILKKGGVFSMIIDYQDHYSYFDKNLSVYNYLKYDTDEWKKFSNNLQYQNRLRHSDYLDLIRQTGFVVVKDAPSLPTDEELEVLRSIRLAPEFRHYALTDLGITGSEIVLVKT